MLCPVQIKCTASWVQGTDRADDMSYFRVRLFQFDRYEHALDREARRADKCLMPNPDHCGRSPATMTVDYLSVLEHSGMSVWLIDS